MGKTQTEPLEAEFKKHALHGGGRRRGKQGGRETFLESRAGYLSLFQDLDHSPTGPALPNWAVQLGKLGTPLRVPGVLSVPSLVATRMSECTTMAATFLSARAPVWLAFSEKQGQEGQQLGPRYQGQPGSPGPDKIPSQSKAGMGGSAGGW